MEQDTIAAVATAAGNAGISVIRMSGPDSLRIAKKIFRPDGKGSLRPRYMALGSVREGEALIDRALGVYFKAPASYTGEDAFEFHCHGGMVVTNRVLGALMQNGARPAEPGEFTKRAFLNGKMDISAAEAVADQIFALSEAGAEMAARHMGGELFCRISAFQERLTDTLSEIEAVIAYPEEDLEEETGEKLLPVLSFLRQELSSLRGTFRQGKLMREGICVVLAGRPNVGKSSLLNAIFGEDRAIVSDTPGTTRDVISEYYTYKSLPIQFLDTAGMREGRDSLEKQGVDRSRAAIRRASCVLMILDASAPLTKEDREAFAFARETGVPLIALLNKTDLPPVLSKGGVAEAFGEEPLEVSALEKKGIGELLEAVYQKAVGMEGLYEGTTIMNARHAFCLARAEESISQAISAIEEGVDLDCVSIDLTSAWHSLGEITGQTLTEEIIDRIFEKFCLGK